ncbi:hypothetical protein V6N11_082152 [Hibiscus sabdariffa]|uniref:RNase H type-1 domain-containing protein n=1 Tax=Hibiscus sabdariffa TaxID=183260 RepID=A0ABR2QH56_9ROSI
MPSSIVRNSCSSLWRALSNVWEALLSNVAWSLGNGHSVNFLTDIWIPALGPLCDFSQASPAAMSHVSFDSVLNDNGEWDIAKLATIFTEDVLPYILGVKPPKPRDGPDRCIWHWTNHHGFELKPAYDRCAPLALEDPDPLWNRIWKLQVPQRSRNDVVFTGDSTLVECALSRGIAWAQYYYDGWLQPLPATGKATIGGLLRDTTGNFIFGFSKFIGVTYSLHAELWSLNVGLQLAWDYGITFLHVQTDCKWVLELLHDPNVESCSISLVRSIHQFWRQAWYVDLIWTPRSGNKAADSLARLSNLSSFDLSLFHSK